MSKLNASRESLLAGAFETGVVIERQRIIDLLENRYSVWLAKSGDVISDRTYGHLREMEAIIELIKGENK